MQCRLNVEQKFRVRNQDLRISTEKPANLWVTLGARRLLELGQEISRNIHIAHILQTYIWFKDRLLHGEFPMFTVVTGLVPCGASADTVVLLFFFLCFCVCAFLFITILCQALLGKRTLLLSQKEWLRFSYVV